MGEKDKTILIVIIAFAVLFGCIVMSCCAGSMFILSRADKDTIISILSEPAEEPKSGGTVEISGNTEQNEPLPSSEGLSEAEQLVIDATEKIRGLSAETKMAPVYQTVEELHEYMISELDDVTDEEFADELGLYKILGFVPDDFDLRQFYVDLYTEQIAGFYDPDENTMYLIEDDSPYNNAVTLAHEYTHYLQYNNPDFEKTLVYDDDYCEDHGETCMVISALIEGDATITESLIDVDSIIGSYKTETGSTYANDSSVFDTAPKFFQDSLLFPYQYGYDFVVYHYLKGGFDSVNKLYTDLPESVEQIMHPEKYLTDHPVTVTMEPFRSVISGDFEIVNEDVLNEDDIRMILASAYEKEWQLDERQAAAGAEGWGGGGFIFAKNEEKPLFFSKSVWDTEEDAKEAETAFTLYLDKRFGSASENGFWSGEDGVSVYLIRQNDILYWMIIPGNFDAKGIVDLINNGSAL